MGYAIQIANKNHYDPTEYGLEYPYNDFIFESPFHLDDIELSKIMMTYFSNFIKTG